eukprot:gene2260-2978_t
MTRLQVFLGVLSASLVLALGIEYDLYVGEPSSLEEPAARDIFGKWKRQHNKEYESDEEHEKRFQVFHDNMQYISAYNSRVKSHKLGLNSLADNSHEEYQATRLGHKPDETLQNKCEELPFAVKDVPEMVDWRKQNAVTSVKDQGSVSRFTFKLSFNPQFLLEGIEAIYTGKTPVSLSPQEVIDCDSDNHGCNGGVQAWAYLWIMKNGGITTEDRYPFKEDTESCSTDKLADHVAQIDGCGVVPPDNETAFKLAVAQQPISVAVAAKQKAFQLYVSGVFDGDCDQFVDHGVTAVGYGTQGGQGYWLIKNSWNEHWGENGYMKIAMGVDAQEPGGKCGEI